MACSGVRSGAQDGMSDARSGAQVGTSDVRSGAQVRPRVPAQLPAWLPGRNSNSTGSAKSVGEAVGQPPREPTTRSCLRRSLAPWAAFEEDLRTVFHQQDGRHGHGAVHRAVDCGSAQRADMGRNSHLAAAPCSGSGFHLKGSIMAQLGSRDQRLAFQTLTQQPVHDPLGLAFGPGLCRGLHRVKQEFAFVVSVAQESGFVRWRLLLAVMPTWVVIHVSPHAEVMCEDCSHELLIRFPKVHQPEQQQPSLDRFT